MQPTIVPGASDQRTCLLLPAVLSAEECRVLIARLEALRFEPTGGGYPRSYRDNDRRVLDDPGLAAWLYARLHPRLPPEHLDAGGVRWVQDGLNPRFRACRYRHGQRFGRHRDGPYLEHQARRSWLTMMLYLNDAGDFAGGRTLFYQGREPNAALLAALAPATGSAAVFAHSLWHEGEAVPSGTKYVLRSDLLYRAVPPGPSTSAGEQLNGHQGYVYSLARLDDGRLASGARDRSVRVWREQPGGWVQDGLLLGHSSSVSALAASEETLWSGDRQGEVRRWQAGRGVLAGAHRGAVLALHALPHGRVASGGADGEVRLWSADGAPAGRWKPLTEGWWWALATAEPGVLVAGGEGGELHAWSLDQGASRKLAALGEPVRALAALSWRGRQALAAGTAGGRVMILDPHSGAVRETAQLHRGAVCALAALGESWLASGGEDDAVRLLEPGAASTLTTHGDFVRALLPLGDGRLASGSYDFSVRLERPQRAQRIARSSSSASKGTARTFSDSAWLETSR